MFRSYGHGHSIGVGALLGLLLAGHVFVLVVAAAAAGVVVGRLWGRLATLGAAVVSRVKARGAIAS